VSRLREVAIVSRTCWEHSGEAGLESTSCGSGAYRLARHTAGVGVDLDAFPEHWGGAPAIPHARFLARSYGDPALPALVTEKTRFVFFVRPRTALFAQAAKEAVLHRGSGLGVSYLGFDLRGDTTPAVTLPDGSHRNPFRDPRVREALALAIDHDDLNRRVYDGQAVVATQLVPGVVYGFDRAVPPPQRDLTRARALLAEAGFPRGFRVELDARQMMLRYGDPLRDHLAALGLDVKLNMLAEDEFFARVRGGRSSLFVLRFSCRSGDAQELLDKWVHSKGKGAGGLGSANFSYDEAPPDLDATIDAARHELAPRERTEKLKAVLGRVNREHLAVPLLQDQDLTFASPEVEWHPRADTFRIVREARFRR
jgi:peptide/nickel transport system substrate-binding protein